MQIARPGVIAQALPLLQHLILRSERQGVDIGEAFDKAMIIVPPLLHARLLQYNLGYPDAIGVVCLSPRQIPFIGIVPFGQ